MFEGNPYALSVRLTKEGSGTHLIPDAEEFSNLASGKYSLVIKSEHGNMDQLENCGEKFTLIAQREKLHPSHTTDRVRIATHSFQVTFDPEGNMVLRNVDELSNVPVPTPLLVCSPIVGASATNHLQLHLVQVVLTPHEKSLTVSFKKIFETACKLHSKGGKKSYSILGVNDESLQETLLEYNHKRHNTHWSDAFDLREIRPKWHIPEGHGVLSSLSIIENGSPVSVMPKGGILSFSNVGLRRIPLAPVDVYYEEVSRLHTGAIVKINPHKMPIGQLYESTSVFLKKIPPTKHDEPAECVILHTATM
jgi:hypothetical protein